MARVLRWGILGCGNVTEKKSGPAFQRATGSALVAVMRRDGAKARDYAERHGVPRFYDDAEALIRDPEVDIVSIATPPSSHREYALACARAGKAAYVEKPMATRHEECVEMIEAFAAAKVPLFVAYYRRALPRFRFVAGVVRERLGAVRGVSIRLTRPVHESERSPGTWPWRVRPEVAGGGHFVDLASHTLDFLDFALGPIAEVHGFAANQAGLYPAEDAVAAAFRFRSGALGSGSWSFATHDRQDEVVVEGERGRITFATFADEPVVVTTAEGVERHEIPHPDAIQQPLVQSIVDELLGIGGPCPSRGESAARTNWVMDRVLEGYRSSPRASAMPE
jgi:1,5-anhydro-D-fructose reductase (1,5-anhydro-D-mannitol-forming)